MFAEGVTAYSNGLRKNTYFDGLDLLLPKGQTTALVGCNTSGKNFLLDVLFDVSCEYEFQCKALLFDNRAARASTAADNVLYVARFSDRRAALTLAAQFLAEADALLAAEHRADVRSALFHMPAVRAIADKLRHARPRLAALTLADLRIIEITQKVARFQQLVAIKLPFQGLVLSELSAMSAFLAQLCVHLQCTVLISLIQPSRCMLESVDYVVHMEGHRISREGYLFHRTAEAENTAPAELRLGELQSLELLPDFRNCRLSLRPMSPAERAAEIERLRGCGSSQNRKALSETALQQFKRSFWTHSVKRFTNYGLLLGLLLFVFFQAFVFSEMFSSLRNDLPEAKSLFLLDFIALQPGTPMARLGADTNASQPLFASNSGAKPLASLPRPRSLAASAPIAGKAKKPDPVLTLLDYFITFFRVGVNARTLANPLLDVLIYKNELIDFIVDWSLCVRQTIPSARFEATDWRYADDPDPRKSRRMISAGAALLQIFDLLSDLNVDIPSIERNREDLGKMFLPLMQRLSPYLSSMMCCAGLNTGFMLIGRKSLRYCNEIYVDAKFAKFPNFNLLQQITSIPEYLIFHGDSEDEEQNDEEERVQEGLVVHAINKLVDENGKLNRTNLSRFVAVGGSLLANLFDDENPLKDIINTRSNQLSRNIRRTKRRSLIEHASIMETDFMDTSGLINDVYEALIKSYPTLEYKKNRLFSIYEAFDECGTLRCKKLKKLLKTAMSDASALIHSATSFINYSAVIILSFVVLSFQSFTLFYEIPFKRRANAPRRRQLFDMDLFAEMLTEIPIQATYTVVLLFSWGMLTKFHSRDFTITYFGTAFLFSFAMCSFAYLMRVLCGRLNIAIILYSLMIGSMLLCTNFFVNINTISSLLWNLRIFSMFYHSYMLIMDAMIPANQKFGVLSTNFLREFVGLDKYNRKSSILCILAAGFFARFLALYFESILYPIRFGLHKKSKRARL